MGSVDFLGNPMGLINDVSSGLEGLVKRGNVGGLFMNVAHGVSDSAAKVSTANSLPLTAEGAFVLCFADLFIPPLSQHQNKFYFANYRETSCIYESATQ